MSWISIPQFFLCTTWPCQVDTQLINDVGPTQRTNNPQIKPSHQIPSYQRLVSIRAQTSCVPCHILKLIEFFYIVDTWVTNQPLHRGYSKCCNPKAIRAHVFLFQTKLALSQSRLPEAESRQILPEFWFITHAEKNIRMEYRHDKAFRTLWNSVTSH